MKYTKLAITLAFLISITSGCKKKETKTEESAASTTTGTTTGTQPPIIDPVYKIKTERTEFSGIASQIDYTYDSEGRATKMVYSNGYYTTLTWTANQCIQKTFSSSTNAEQSSITYNLNASGNAISYNFSGSSANYEYNSEGYLVKASSSNSSSNITTNYTISDGNVAGYTSTNGGTVNYEYYTDKLNTIGDLNKGFAILGKQNKNLTKKMNSSISSTSTSADYTYEFDSKNRVVKMIQVSGSNTTTTSYTYY